MRLLCPEKDQVGALFREMFYGRWLPADMQNLLAEDDFSTVSDKIAERRRLVALNIAPATREGVETFQEAEVPAGRQPRQPDGSGNGAGPELWVAAGLCWAHFNFGSNARKCEKPVFRIRISFLQIRILVFSPNPDPGNKRLIFKRQKQFWEKFLFSSQQRTFIWYL